MAPDPYKYFRVEAHELLGGMTEGVLKIENGNAGEGCVAGLLRLAHTLKGAARVVKQPAVAELAHGMEDLLAPFRENQPVPKEQAREMLALLDRIGTRLAEVAPPPGAAAAASVRPRAEQSFSTVRVEIEEVEGLLERLGGLSAEIASMELQSEALTRAACLAAAMRQQWQAGRTAGKGAYSVRTLMLSDQVVDSLHSVERQFTASVERAVRQVGQARELANRIRLLPAETIFAPLSRVVRDAAVTLGKQVGFTSAGGDIRLDAQVLSILRDALFQLVRNAVAHGIEPPEVRLRGGKPAAGVVTVEAIRRGNRVVFFCRDDGAGVDLTAIRKAAVDNGSISAGQAGRLELQETMNLLLRGGLSTSHRVDEISGRGVGLDVVRAAVARLAGEISIQTEAGKGTTVEICVPASLTAVLALTVGAGGTTASLPLACVRETRRVDREEIVRSGTQELMVYEGSPIPFLSLGAALGLEDPVPPPARWTVLIVSSASERAAIGVEQLNGTSTQMIRALPVLAPATSVVNGASLDREGNPQLFLDPDGLIEAARNGRPRIRKAGALGDPVLIIDDSLTTRAVEQSILESAGYRVELAASAEEGLEKALTTRFCLFLVDVEMPGMNGFDFISRTRSDPALRSVPAVLVTSRNSPDDCRRGEEVGARAYIVKSEFDQSHFLRTIEELVR